MNSWCVCGWFLPTIFGHCVDGSLGLQYQCTWINWWYFTWEAWHLMRCQWYVAMQRGVHLFVHLVNCKPLTLCCTIMFARLTKVGSQFCKWKHRKQHRVGSNKKTTFVKFVYIYCSLKKNNCLNPSAPSQVESVKFQFSQNLGLTENSAPLNWLQLEA